MKEPGGAVPMKEPGGAVPMKGWIVVDRPAGSQEWGTDHSGPLHHSHAEAVEELMGCDLDDWVYAVAEVTVVGPTKQCPPLSLVADGSS